MAGLFYLKNSLEANEIIAVMRKAGVDGAELGRRKVAARRSGAGIRKKRDKPKRTNKPCEHNIKLKDLIQVLHA